MNIDQGIRQLKESGLNIFLSAKVTDLPEDLYPFTDDQKQKTLVMLGAGGRTLWRKLDFTAADPVDSFSVAQMKWFGENVLKNEIEILFPQKTFQLPLQRLGRQFNFSHQSPLGIDVSSEFGLWFAFRGVFLTGSPIPSTNLEKMISPCELCADKPCLSVTEFADARMKCPVKSELHYTIEQQEYHRTAALKFKGLL